MPSAYGVVGISQPHVVAHRKVPSVAVEQAAYEATAEDEEGYVEKVRQFAQLEEEDACKVDSQGSRSIASLVVAANLVTSCQSTSMLKGWGQMHGYGWEEMGHSEKATPHVSILRLATTGFAGRVVRLVKNGFNYFILVAVVKPQQDLVVWLCGGEANSALIVKR